MRFYIFITTWLWWYLNSSFVYDGAPCRPGLPTDLLLGSYEERLASGCSQVQLGFRYETREQRFTISIMQLSNCSALCLLADQKMYVRFHLRKRSFRNAAFNVLNTDSTLCNGCHLCVCVCCSYVRVAVLPCVEATRCLFRTRGYLPQDVTEVKEVFGMQISQSALRQKTLRVDVCYNKSGREACLVGRRSSLMYVSE